MILKKRVENFECFLLLINLTISVFFIFLFLKPCLFSVRTVEVEPLMNDACPLHEQHSHRISLGSNYVKSTAIIRQRFRPESIQGNCSQVVLHVDVTSSNSNLRRGQGLALIVNVERLSTTSNGWLRIEYEGQRFERQTVSSNSNDTEGHSILTSRPDGLVVSMQDVVEIELFLTVFTSE